ncbi:MAG: hypothetical protein WA478_04180, partial [Pseudolabrys sp.]
LSFVFWPVGNDRTDELVQKVYRVVTGSKFDPPQRSNKTAFLSVLSAFFTPTDLIESYKVIGRM